MILYLYLNASGTVVYGRWSICSSVRSAAYGCCGNDYNYKKTCADHTMG